MSERRTIQTHGAAIGISESGEGEPVCVFLHYWGGSARTWDGVVDRVNGNVRCVSVDQRGWGGSLVSDGRYDLIALADDVQSIVAELDVHQYILVGHSMGGKVAQIVATRHPAGLAGLVLVAFAVRGFDVPPRYRAHAVRVEQVNGHLVGTRCNDSTRR
jgi:3-oxoadipate enol-lactonase